VKISPYQPGCEFEQLKVYNTAASALPKFKPASLVELQRRTTARDFDPSTRFYAYENAQVVGYCTYQKNGRLSYPWCLPGHEAIAEPLFVHTLEAMKAKGITRVFTAYRKDWPQITGFFGKHGFTLAREMINFVMSQENMPTPSARLGSAVTKATPEDAAGIFALDPSVFRVATAQALRDALWNNPWITPESIFVMRNKTDGVPLAAGIFITNALYADPRAVDSEMPCFRLGAFGTEGTTTKRIRGLFSFVTRPEKHVTPIGMDMVGYAMNLLTDEDDISSYGAQVASDAPALLSFYQRMFERQGSFPVYERDLSK
jgi:hypothetical protein